MNAAEFILAEVAEELAWLAPAPVFIGGSTIGLFLDALGRDQLRPTKDVDCIVPAVLTRTDWFQLESELRRRGWQPDPDGPIWDRGARDPLASADFEDLVALLDGCQALESAVNTAESDVQQFIAAWCRSLVSDDALLTAADGQLPRGGDITARRQRLHALLLRLANSTAG